MLTIFHLCTGMKKLYKLGHWDVRFCLVFHLKAFCILLSGLTRLKQYFSWKGWNWRQEERSLLWFLRRLNWFIAGLKDMGLCAKLILNADQWDMKQINCNICEELSLHKKVKKWKAKMHKREKRDLNNIQIDQALPLAFRQ